ncbi:MAG TPA: phosphomannomutase/phosphoglucomutase, partial [Candidatus Ozemobacteraceae bacterium]|nr:phosphomannomutase/phosphoglucomutase [Candidatus Ozemobacteraceae bacterium]
YHAYQRQRHVELAKISKKLRIVVDAGNGTAGAVVPPLLRALGCEVVELYCTPDGNFPNHHPDPTIPANLQDLSERVKAEQADAGFAFDGDADRLGLVDETGRILFGDEIMILLARDIATRHKGAKVIGEVKCSKRMYDEIAKAGAEPIMWKTGHSLIKAKMKEEQALLAGEMSGHLFFAEEYFGYDDALHAALEIACILARSLAKNSRGLAALMADVPPAVATPEIRTDCADEMKFKVVQTVREMVERHAASKAEPRVTSLTTIDGIRADFADGWGLVRASNTQPILVSRYEAADAGSLAAYQAFFEGLIVEAQKIRTAGTGTSFEKAAGG